jgi:hypothetical protein
VEIALGLNVVGVVVVPVVVVPVPLDVLVEVDAVVVAGFFDAPCSVPLVFAVVPPDLVPPVAPALVLDAP